VPEIRVYVSKDVYAKLELLAKLSNTTLYGLVKKVLEDLVHGVQLNNLSDHSISGHVWKVMAYKTTNELIGHDFIWSYQDMAYQNTNEKPSMTESRPRHNSEDIVRDVLSEVSKIIDEKLGSFEKRV